MKDRNVKQVLYGDGYYWEREGNGEGKGGLDMFDVLYIQV
jgi:hypothetical protein